MLDTCLLLAECLNTSESMGDSVIGDDMIAGIASQIRRDHHRLGILVSSGADIPSLELLLSVVDSQSAVIERLSDMVSIQGRQLSEVATNPSAQHQQPPQQQPQQQRQQESHQTAEVYQGPPRAEKQPQRHPPPKPSQDAPVTEQAPHQHSQTKNRAGIRTAGDVDDVQFESIEMQEAPAKQAPTMDDIFGSGATAPSQRAAAPPPSQSMDHTTHATSEMTHSEPRVASNTDGSLNADNDDFDSFLNNRLQKH